MFWKSFYFIFHIRHILNNDKKYKKIINRGKERESDTRLGKIVNLIQQSLYLNFWPNFYNRKVTLYHFICNFFIFFRGFETANNIQMTNIFYYKIFLRRERGAVDR